MSRLWLRRDKNSPVEREALALDASRVKLPAMKQVRRCCKYVLLHFRKQVVRLCQMSGCCQMALVKQDKHLCGSNIRHPKHEAMPAHERFGLIQNSGRAGHISLGKFQAGEQHLIRSEGVDAFHLSRQLEALLPMLLGGIQIIPLVSYTGQAKMRFAGNRLRRITCQSQDAPVGLSRQRRLVVCFLYLAQIDCSRYGVDGIPGIPKI